MHNVTIINSYLITCLSLNIIHFIYYRLFIETYALHTCIFIDVVQQKLQIKYSKCKNTLSALRIIRLSLYMYNETVYMSNFNSACFVFFL